MSTTKPEVLAVRVFVLFRLLKLGKLLLFVRSKETKKRGEALFILPNPLVYGSKIELIRNWKTRMIIAFDRCPIGALVGVVLLEVIKSVRLQTFQLFRAQRSILAITGFNLKEKHTRTRLLVPSPKHISKQLWLACWLFLHGVAVLLLKRLSPTYTYLVSSLLIRRRTKPTLEWLLLLLLNSWLDHR